MFPGARVLQLSYNEARVCATVRRAKQRVYTTLLLTLVCHFDHVLLRVAIFVLNVAIAMFKLWW